jgi:SPX domain protein involved in polyphosphate accumulation
MMKADLAPLPVLERYELKYTIPEDMVGPISAFIEPYCALDKHSEMSHDSFYQVNSLYLDTPEYLFLRNRKARIHNRFNMRVRSYSENPSPPYFLEVKQKAGDVIRKHRARIKDPDLARVLDPNAGPECLGVAGDADNAALFRDLVHRFNAAPVVMTRYRRKAYFSHCDEYARVTFDAGLRWMQQREYKPLCLDGLAPSDVETLFDDRTSVVLELKCFTQYVPLWMLDLIRTFDLRQRGFSKYGAGMAQVFRKYEFDDGNMVPTDGFFGNSVRGGRHER